MNSVFHASEQFFASQLFHDVQMAGVFSDSKSFADAIPLQSYQDAIDAYTAALANGKPDLKDFVDQHFVIPIAPEEPELAPGSSVNDYIDSLWPKLHRDADDKRQGSLLALPHPYVVPGGRFREIYYWDSYFTGLGLVRSGRTPILQSMLDNFVHLQSRVGLIPNGNRSYYATRSQPPVMALMVTLLQQQSDLDVRQYLPALIAEHAFWMQGTTSLSEGHQSHRRVVSMPDGSVLNRYWDDNALPRPESYREDMQATAHMGDAERSAFFRNIRAACESGWDFSARWLANANDLESIQTTDIVPIDLNCLLFALENKIAELLASDGQQPQSKQWYAKAERRKRSVMTYLWDRDTGLFMDYHLYQGGHSTTRSLATVLPLFVGIAEQHQAEKVAANLSTDFLVQGGLLTTLTNSHQQWDAPNGWAPLHWFAVKGLQRYRLHDLADTVMQRWLETVETYYADHQTLMEKYNLVDTHSEAEGGEYEVQHGFGWTNGVTQAFNALTKTR